VNRFNPFGPHIINRGAKGVTQKIRENWVTNFEVIFRLESSPELDESFQANNSTQTRVPNLLNPSNILTFYPNQISQNLSQ
ncbi:hypothetical protein BpHYR1_050451, partial [Brachionus plicatilis]